MIEHPGQETDKGSGQPEIPGEFSPAETADDLSPSTGEDFEEEQFPSRKPELVLLKDEPVPLKLNRARIGSKIRQCSVKMIAGCTLTAVASLFGAASFVAIGRSDPLLLIVSAGITLACFFHYRNKFIKSARSWRDRPLSGLKQRVEKIVKEVATERDLHMPLVEVTRRIDRGAEFSVEKGGTYLLRVDDFTVLYLSNDQLKAIVSSEMSKQKSWLAGFSPFAVPVLATSAWNLFFELVCIGCAQQNPYVFIEPLSVFSLIPFGEANLRSGIRALEMKNDLQEALRTADPVAITSALAKVQGLAEVKNGNAAELERVFSGEDRKIKVLQDRQTGSEGQTPD